MGNKGKTREVYRDAGTGHFITKEEAKKHPKTSVKETIKQGAPKEKDKSKRG